MAAYRYVAFSRGRRPSVAETEELQRLAAHRKCRVAYGTNSRDHTIAIAFEAAAFDDAVERDPAFAALVRCWELRGCEIVDHMAFVKDSKVLPAGRAPRREDFELPADASAHNDRELAAKAAAAQEAEARSRLDVAATLERYAAIERLGTSMPYALMAAGALTAIGVGWYVTSALRRTDYEPRKETIERVIDEPVGTPTPSPG